MGEKERNEIDGSEGAIITLRLILEYGSYAGRPFVMISRCNGVRAHNSCREFLVLLSAQKYTESGNRILYQDLTSHKSTYFCLDTKVTKDQAEVFKTGSLILR